MAPELKAEVNLLVVVVRGERPTAHSAWRRPVAVVRRRFDASRGAGRGPRPVLPVWGGSGVRQRTSRLSGARPAFTRTALDTRGRAWSARGRLAGVRRSPGVNSPFFRWHQIRACV